MLDLVVTRLLVYCLVQVVPSLCEGHDSLCGSLVATYAESNGRLQLLGRRCRATLAGSEYVLSAVTPLPEHIFSWSAASEGEQCTGECPQAVQLMMGWNSEGDWSDILRLLSCRAVAHGVCSLQLGFCARQLRYVCKRQTIDLYRQGAAARCVGLTFLGGRHL